MMPVDGERIMWSIEMYKAFPLAALVFTASAAGAAQAQVMPNCVGYLTADAAFEKVEKPYHRATAAAKKDRDKKIRALRKVRDAAFRKAHSVYNDDREKAESGPLSAELKAARAANSRAFDQAVETAKAARRDVESRATAAYVEAMKPHETAATQKWREYRRLRRIARRSGSTSGERRAARNARAAYRSADQARSRARTAAKADRKQEQDFAKSLYDDALRDARAARGKADAAAHKKHKETVAKVLKPSRNALTAARLAAGKAYDTAKTAAERAYRKSMKAEIDAFEKAKKARDDAYIAAFARPVPGVRRRVDGFDRGILMKVARHERKELCPKM